MKWQCGKILAVVLLMAGCSTEQVASINLKNHLQKSSLKDEWHTRATVVDKQSHNSFAFVGLECPVETVKFVITKNRLMAYRSYQKGTDGKTMDQTSNLVSSFRIIKHYDLQLSEQSKTFDESTARPWHEREFIKVDWSRNLAPHLECNQWLQSVTALDLDVGESQDDSEPYKVRMHKNYIETTVNAIVAPDHEACSESSEWSCNPAQYRVKFSFKKLVTKSDYQKQHYPDNDNIRVGTKVSGEPCLEGGDGCQNIKDLWLHSSKNKASICDPLKDSLDQCYAPKLPLNSRFGFFRTVIHAYDRRDGFNQRTQELLINRYNIWAENVDSEGRLLPMADRVPKKIVYYLNPGFPKELYPSVEHAAREWNVAFSNIVAKTKNQCSLAFARNYVQKNHLREQFKKLGLVEIVPENLERACQVIFEKTKHNKPQEVFFTGNPYEVEEVFGPIFEIRKNSCNAENVRRFAAKYDLTYELVRHNIYELNDDNIERACAVLESASTERNLVEIFSWEQPGDLRYNFVNGVRRPEGVGLLGYGPSGVDPRSGEIISGNANIYLAAITRYATSAVDLMADIYRLKKSKSESRLTDTDGVDDVSITVTKAISSMSGDTFRSRKYFSSFNQNLQTIVGRRLMPNANNLIKPLEEGEEIQAYLSAIFREQKETTSPYDREQFLSSRSACFSHLGGELPYFRLSQELRGMERQEKINYVKAKIFEAVLLHELGHTVGLRHNFKGAYDALNFPPNFWGVNTADFRMRDGLAEEELRSSSIMDYHKSFNSDFSGLGLYDYAALLAGYAGLVEIFDESENKFVPHSMMPELDLVDYQDLPYLFSDAFIHNQIKRQVNHAKDKYRRGDLSAHVDIKGLGFNKTPANLFKRRVIDIESAKKLVFLNALRNNSHNIALVPYAFCTDGDLGRNEISCRKYQFGSSPSEVIDNAIKDYEMAKAMESLGAMYLPRSATGYLNYIYGRVYEPILRTYQRMYMLGDSELKIYSGVYDLSRGVKKGLDFISRNIQSVEPGQYCKNDDGHYELYANQESCPDQITIDKDQGRKFTSVMSDRLIGGPTKLGSVYEKILALLVLVDDTAVIEHRFNNWQRGKYSIGLYRAFAPQISDIFAHIFADNMQNLAPKIKVGDDGQVELIYQDLFGEPSKNDADAAKIIPPSSRKLRDMAVILSMAGLSSFSDHKLDFAKRAQVKTIRPGQTPIIDHEQINFRDPFTGVTYQAHKAGLNEASPGYDLVKSAHQFVCDGTRDNHTEGPWHQAKVQVQKASHALEQARTTMSTARDDKDLEKELLELAAAEANLKAQSRILHEKIRMLDLLSTLSRHFAE